MFDRFVRKDAFESVDLRAGERILHVTHLHLVVLARRLVLPLIVLLISGGLLFYRSIGGQFLVAGAAAEQQFTIVDALLAVMLVGTAAAWLLARRSRGSNRLRLGLFMVGTILALWLFFRAEGGRLVSIDPYATNHADMLNVVLFVTALLAVLAGVYAFLDWKTDQLILTSQRVIHDHEQPWVRRIQEQLSLQDIQSVHASTKTYLEHWFNFGLISIKSASFNRVMVFTSASNPREMQTRIMAEVNKRRREQSEADFRRLVEARVYNNEPPRAKRVPQIQRSYTPRMLGWLFEANPVFNEENETYIWHPHWFFLIKALLRPTIALLLALIVLALGAELGAVEREGMAAPLLVIGLVFVGWAAWEIEDHRNDRYILTPTQVIDIEKKPFGPESRRSAGLDALQNVTFRTTLVSRILGYGDVVLSTAGPGEGLTFHDIPNPREVVALINSYLEEFQKIQKERNLEDTLKLLRYYHTLHQHYGNGAQPPESHQNGNTSGVQTAQ